jgi:hypothetical protein
LYAGIKNNGGQMTRKQAIKKTLFKFTWIKDHLTRNRTGDDELDAFIDEHPEYFEYDNDCPLCELFRDGNRNYPDCSECILNSDNCFYFDGGFQNFLDESSNPKKKKYCEWVIKKCEETMEAK